MKKLMIAAFAVAFAAVAQAATVTWSQMGCGAYGDPDNEFEGTMYLMLGGTSVASSFVETVIGAGSDFEAAFNNAVASAVGIGENWGEGVDVSTTIPQGGYSELFVVALDASNKGVYVSSIYSESITAVGESDLNFYGEGSYDSPFAAGVKDYDAAIGGWYTAGTSSVPEPTSALMLLVGLAGLALKRKVA